MAYEQVTGSLGTERGDLQTALLATVMSNLWRSKKTRRFKLREFLPKWHSRKQTPEDMLAMVKALNAMYGGDTQRKEE
jgi:hypothetical protein